MEASIQLAARGCEIVMCCRNVEKAEKARAEVAKRSGADKATVYIVQLDLADLENIGTFRSRYDAVEGLANRPVDMLILNAGIMTPPHREETKQGFEAQLGTNVIGHFKFLTVMFDLCKAATQSRIVIVSSIMHKYAHTIHLEDLQREKHYSKWPAYCESKLADLLLVFKINRILQEKNITNVFAVGCHP